MALAFFIGLLGSVHCVGMCGPLLLALPNAEQSRWRQLVNQLLYQIGRIMTYGILGMLLGLLGAGTAIQGWQQYVSIITGCGLVIAGFYHLLQRIFLLPFQPALPWIKPVLNQLGYWMQKPGGHLMVGLLNGLLPCGMVYLALASALNTGSVVKGLWFMIFFGLGTLPLMWSAGFFGHFLKHRLKMNQATWLPALFVLMGIWFILRGASLDIPYLSPLITVGSSSDPLCH